VCGVARGEARSGRSGDAPAEDRLSLARKMDRVLAPRFRLAAHRAEYGPRSLRALASNALCGGVPRPPLP